MQKLVKQYRNNYYGEHVNLVGTYKNSEWEYTKEFLNPSFDVKPLSDIAVVIGNGESRLEFDMRHFMSFKTGPLDTNWSKQYGRKKFYTYGCNALYRDFSPDFLFVTGDEITKEVVNSGYCEDHVVYANNWVLPQYPNKFHYIPENPAYNSGALAAYMAAFDGHKKIFMLGFDGNDTNNLNCNVYNNTNGYPTKEYQTLEEFWVVALKNVMDVYDDTEFIRVAPSENFRTPEPWKYNLNFRTISFRQFVLEADI